MNIVKIVKQMYVFFILMNKETREEALTYCISEIKESQKRGEKEIKIHIDCFFAKVLRKKGFELTLLSKEKNYNVYSINQEDKTP